MAFIKTIPEDQAEGLVQDQYQSALKSQGYVPNYIRALSLHPEVYDAWTKLISAIRSHMKLRRYELVTFASAMALGCRYCMLAHGAVLRKNFFSAEELVAIVKDFRNAGLSAEEVSLMSFAQKVITQASGVDERDIDDLRKHGLSDAEILDVILTSTARSFFSKTLDSTGAVPDDVYRELGPDLLPVLTPGRPL